MIDRDNSLPQLPDGWVWTRIGDVADLLRGVSYAKDESSKEIKGGYVPILRANNINRELNFNDLVYVLPKRIKDEQYVRAFDILIAMSSGSKDLVGKASQAKSDFNGGFGAFCGLVRITPELDRKFVGFYFQSPNYRNEISQLSSGININNLRRSHIELLSLSLPPLPEQHRIVAKIEELFTKLDAGVEGLKKVKAQLKVYRQAVLKHAFEGKLTKKWRDARKGEMEPASMLLEKMKAERIKSGKYKELPPLDKSNLPKLPEGWTWTRVGEIGKVLGGKRLPKGHKYATNHTKQPYIRVIDFMNLTVNKAGIKYISDETHNRISPYTISKNDVYVSIAGTIGRTGTIPADLDGANLTENAAKITDLQYYNNRALSLALNTTFSKEQISRLTIHTNQPKLALFRIEQIVVPIPPLLEQQIMVTEIERHFSVADQTEKAVEQNLLRAQRLRQSILKRAFEGKLVSQDPNDEPAEKLLERIKAEKTKREAEKKAAGRGRKRLNKIQGRLI